MCRVLSTIFAIGGICICKWWCRVIFLLLLSESNAVLLDLHVLTNPGHAYIEVARRMVFLLFLVSILAGRTEYHTVYHTIPHE